MSVLISCETGGDRTPSWLIDSGNSTPHGSSSLGESLLDPAARYAARKMAARLSVPLIENEYAADLVDVTRSARHRSVFPPSARRFGDETRHRLLAEIHHPYRQRIQTAIAELLHQHPVVVHLSIRSFVSRKNGTLRRTDVGLLYDPSREDEVDFCLDWIDEMYEEVPMVRVRRNYPRRGTTESLVTAMRSAFPEQTFIGIEVLLNRAWAARPVLRRDEAIDGMCRSLEMLLELESDAEFGDASPVPQQHAA
ncbi:N-formylglutamate amidohydrolase [Novipirellula artificiosorum]|uniref:N-formylglutamate amidohydrolase n=1 Tax=Novipirellula artificiosorum TaxID=2528016 RepID=A0A5C6D3U4_9BACT|nr:N-formylglutamate amidohydrolase [Novipirellula artificiosorum]TWU31562.1 N-formylglutamate amidohydrolase [Novipirellula artificiosorum]